MLQALCRETSNHHLLSNVNNNKSDETNNSEVVLKKLEKQALADLERTKEQLTKLTSLFQTTQSAIATQEQQLHQQMKELQTALKQQREFLSKDPNAPKSLLNTIDDLINRASELDSKYFEPRRIISIPQTKREEVSGHSKTCGSTMAKIVGVAVSILAVSWMCISRYYRSF